MYWNAKIFVELKKVMAGQAASSKELGLRECVTG
jgi:hypothetical protein